MKTMVNVAVIGDIMLDVYTELENIRMSPEAPVPVGRCGKSEYYLGGAANVAANCKQLGSTTKLMGVMGDDEPGRIIRKLCCDSKIDLQWGGSKGITTVKTRLVDARGQHLIRFDKEDKLGREQWKGLVYQTLNLWSNFISDVHSVVISDYDKGVGVNYLSNALTLCRESGKFIVANTKPVNWRLYNEVDVMVLNQDEATSIMSELGVLYNFDDATAIDFSGLNFVEALQKTGDVNWRNIVITLGSRGLIHIDVPEGNRVITRHYSTTPVTVADVAGAGDTIVATIASAGACTPAVLKFAQANAAKVVSKRGTQTP